ncbi:MAG: periplasmic heavy metal sensor [Pseudorhodoplanes sp.]
MSFALSTRLGDNPSARWLVLSLALNVFFICVAAALVTRHHLMPPPPAQAPVDRSVGGRIERLAATLPPDDAAILRATYGAQAASIEPRQQTFRRALDEIRTTLRAEPFAPGDLRKAMTDARAARQALDRSQQDVIAEAAGAMSAAGRRKLADWPPPPRGEQQNTRR